MFNTVGEPLVTVDQVELESLREVARAAEAVCIRGWITETAGWLRRAVDELEAGHRPRHR